MIEGLCGCLDAAVSRHTRFSVLIRLSEDQAHLLDCCARGYN